MIKRPRPELHDIEEIRRFEVIDGISYRKLHRRVRKAFGLTDGFDLAFDENNITITMTDDQDMQHITKRSHREFSVDCIDKNKNKEKDSVDSDGPIVWMVIVPSHNLGERWIMKAVRLVARGGRVILVTAASVITLIVPLIPLLPAPHVAAIGAIAVAVMAITTASQQSTSCSEELTKSSAFLA
ncbi:hypothetical protein INT45_006018 [Circinella minor]|uniref:Uncharacterized protein n=1 Tax=Circinella minor TaxID=1195481 RepID=A0A8H7SBY9_9FUNG|nr:hypothetical protein INT45_006018 [Circinella minor]